MTNETEPPVQIEEIDPETHRRRIADGRQPTPDCPPDHRAPGQRLRYKQAVQAARNEDWRAFLRSIK